MLHAGKALTDIDALNLSEGNVSHAAPRIRRELLFNLLDNPARGAVVEVGTMNGSLTSLFGCPHPSPIVAVSQSVSTMCNLRRPGNLCSTWSQ
jgi:hypothetical protein